MQHNVASHRLLVLLVGGAIAGTVGWLLAHGPGGHSGELTQAIWFHDGDLPFFRTLLRACLSIILVALGASLGREAAPKQVGAAIASLVSRWQRLPPTERRLLAACGAGAGMGAVYNVPLGGAVFGIEVLLGTLKLPLLAPVLLSSVFATGVSWLMLPNRPTYEVPIFELTGSQMAWAALLGPLAGLVAVAYVRAISWADSRKPKGWMLLVLPVAVFAALGVLGIPFPQLLGNGKDVVQEAFVGKLGLGLLLVILLLKPLTTAACLGSGAPGGLFTPTITVGAVLGGAFGHVWGLLWPGTPEGPCAIIGATALLAAATQGPISALVLMQELTGHLDLMLLPLMLAIAGASITARSFESRSIYSGRIHVGRSSVDEQRKDMVSVAAGYPEVLRRLLQQPRRDVPLLVVDESGACVGQITAEQLDDPDALPPLVEIATAGDLARPEPPRNRRV